MWIPSHVGIVGNDQADRLVKEAPNQKILLPTVARKIEYLDETFKNNKTLYYKMEAPGKSKRTSCSNESKNRTYPIHS